MTITLDKNKYIRKKIDRTNHNYYTNIHVAITGQSITIKIYGDTIVIFHQFGKKLPWTDFLKIWH